MRLLLDTNLLLLLVVGLTDRSLIARHKRTQSFTPEDFDLLAGYTAGHELLVTPNILTETSNLSRQVAEPQRTRVSLTLAQLVASVLEIYIPSHDVVQSTIFQRVGLTDAGIVEATGEAYAVLTSDLDLYLALENSGRRVVNFNHRRTWS